MAGHVRARLIRPILFDGRHLNNEPRWRRADENHHASTRDKAIRKDRLPVTSSKDVNAMRCEPVADCDKKDSCAKSLHASLPSGRWRVWVWVWVWVWVRGHNHHNHYDSWTRSHSPDRNHLNVGINAMTRQPTSRDERHGRN